MSLNKKNNPQVPLANSIGDFIRYWGFRRIHGQIWTLIYLSKSPLSGAELAATLKVSKALISTALKELEEHKLILKAVSENSKTKRFRANADVFEVIQDVLLTREMKIMHRIETNFQFLDKVNKSSREEEIDPERLADLKEMIKSANVCLNAVVKLDSLETLRFLASLMSKGK